MTRTGFRKVVFFLYSLLRTSHDFENNRKTMLKEKNQSLLSWVVSQPPSYAQKKSAHCHHDSPGAAIKPLLIVEASLKIRYFDFKERSHSINL